MRKLNNDDFIEKAKNIHGDRYDYSKSNYIGSKIGVVIVCPLHGEFMQKPNDHLNKKGCPECAKIIINNSKYLNTNDFIEKAKNIHGDKYDYSLVDYERSNVKIKIKCNIHGIFKQTPNNHLSGQGCPICYPQKQLRTLNEFINKAISIHGDKYDYSLVVYKRSNIKVKIICGKHGVFEQTPNSHLCGQGCPICGESKGEKIITEFLKSKNINFIREKKFNDCKNIKLLPFDFYLPDKNVLIEFDGVQHNKPIDFFGGEKAYNLIKINDNIKTNYAKDNNINLIRISYLDNIFDLLRDL